MRIHRNLSRLALLAALVAIGGCGGCGGGGGSDASPASPIGSEGSFPPAPALAWNAPLTQAALVHSEDIAAFDFFSHTGCKCSNAGQRATAGCVRQSRGESIAAGNTCRSCWTMVPGSAR